MAGLAQTFQVSDHQWLYNAVDSRLYRVAAEGGSLPSPTAEVHFGCSEGELSEWFDRGPSALVLGVTEQCNLRCRYCVYSGFYAGQRTHSDQRMTAEAALRGVDDFMMRSAGHDRVSISFFGGEPLVAFDVVRRVVDHVEECHPHRRCRFGLTTNGTQLSGAVADYLARNRFLLGVSLDGPRAVHDASRRFPSQQGSWEVVMRNLATLAAAEPKYYRTHVGLLAVLSDPRHVAAVHDFFTAEPLVASNSLIVSPMRSFDAGVTLLPQLNAEEAAAYEQYVEDLGRRFAEDVLSGDRSPDHFAEALFVGPVRSIHGRSTRPLEEERFPAMFCVPGADTLYLAADGTYHACPNLAGAFPLGDVQHGMDPERGLALVREFLAMGQANCQNCWAVRLCRACVLRARDGDQLSLQRLRQWCPMFLRQLERAFRIYIFVASRDRAAWTRYFSRRPENPLEFLAE